MSADETEPRQLDLKSDGISQSANLLAPTALPATMSMILASLECNLCLSLICEPISISCGHSFCRVCLVKSLRRHKKKCPSCREVCHVAAETASENIIVKSIACAVDPALYAQRLQEAAAEKEAWTTVYPIFYYNQALFPGSKLDLHLFEPRYKLMMKRVVDTTRAFAYVPNFHNYSAAVGDVALIAELKHVEFMADGRCLLEAVLSKRKRIVEHYVEDGTQGLHFCSVVPFEDEPISTELMPATLELRAKAEQLARQLMQSSYGASVEQHCGPMPTELEAFSLWLANVSISERAKFEQLQSRSTHDRLLICTVALEVTVGRLNNSVASELGRQLGGALSALSTSQVFRAMQQAGMLGVRRRSESHEHENENEQEGDEGVDDDDVDLDADSSSSRASAQDATATASASDNDDAVENDAASGDNADQFR